MCALALASLSPLHVRGLTGASRVPSLPPPARHTAAAAAGTRASPLPTSTRSTAWASCRRYVCVCVCVCVVVQGECRADWLAGWRGAALLPSRCTPLPHTSRSATLHPAAAATAAAALTSPTPAPPQAFARLSAVYGGTYMLAKPDVEVVYDPDSGVAVGVRSEGETARAKLVVGDPTYFREKARVGCVWEGWGVMGVRWGGVRVGGMVVGDCSAVQFNALLCSASSLSRCWWQQH